jgi:iron complex transport system ATP-binding protein
MPSADAARPELSLSSASVGTRLTNVSIKLAPGECCVVVGANGAGKSTLLRALSGLEKLDGGRATIGQQLTSELSPRDRAGLVAWLPQRPQLGEAVRVVELVSSGRYRFGESHGEALAHARRALTEVSAAELADRPCDRISGGELQRVLLATLLAQEAPLLLVDEPGNHLDPAQQIAVYSLLGELWRRGAGLLVVTHDINLAKHLGDPSRVRVLGLQRGSIVFDAKLDDDSLRAELSQLYGVELLELSLENGRHFVPTGRLTSASTSDPARGSA